MIWINNTDKNAIEVDTLIRKRRDSTEGKAITSDMAVEFLRMTNHFANIKFLLQQIKKSIKTDDDVALYKNFVLGAIEGREVSKEAYKMLEDMAVRGGFREEFDEANNTYKIYKFDTCMSFYTDKDKEFRYCMQNEVPTVGGFKECRHAELSFVNTDFTTCQELLLPSWSTIYFNNCSGLRGNLSIPMWSIAIFDGANLSEVNKLSASPRCKISMQEINSMPEIIDVSGAERVYLKKSDLSRVKELKIGDCKEVDFAYATGLPEVIDVSLCEETNFHMADASNVKRIVFKTKNEAEHFCCWSKNFNGTAVYLDGGNFEHEYSLPKSRNYGMGL